MQHLIKYAFFALAVSALPAINKRDDDDDDDFSSRNLVRPTTNLLVGPSATLRASMVIARSATNTIRPTGLVIATVDGPVPTSLPRGLYQCGRSGDGIARLYNNTQYTCFDGDILCPILSNGRRTRACGLACYDPARYSCDDDRLLNVPCAQNDDCDDDIDFEDVDDIRINRNALPSRTRTQTRTRIGGAATTRATRAASDNDDDDDDRRDAVEMNNNVNNNNDDDDDDRRDAVEMNSNVNNNNNNNDDDDDEVDNNAETNNNENDDDDD